MNLDEFFAFEQEFAVVTLHPEDSFRVDAINLDHVARDVFEEIAIVADNEARESRSGKQLLEPEDPVKIKMVRWFVEQENVEVRTSSRAIASRYFQPPDSDARIDVKRIETQLGRPRRS